MASHAHTIGTRLVATIRELIATVASENGYTESPSVQFRKRPRGNRTLSIQSGITIVPAGVEPRGGTSDREDSGYRYVIGIASGTISDQLEVDDWPFAAWEQAIRQRYQQRRIGSLGLTDACELHCSIRPGDLPDWAELGEKIEATTLLLTCYVRESRR